jgi:23S rRNA pseudouridine1911/1915/1917 synthase
MPYVRKKRQIYKEIIAYKFLIDEFGCTMREAQKWIDRKRVYQDGQIVKKKNTLLVGSIEIIVFEANFSGLMPIFETPYFAVFDKPSGLLIHPNKLSDEQSLNDDIKYLFGANANVTHRIDKETSGLVLVSKDKKTEISLKKSFENRDIYKEYLALVEGKIDREILIDERLKVDVGTSLIRIKSHIDSEGKISKTQVFPISYNVDKNTTLIKAIPLTGRTHQIRAHLFHMKHRIIGDPIYGVDESFTDRYLNKEIDLDERLHVSGANRLLLHANKLSFEFDGLRYNIQSKINFKEIVDEYNNS